MGAHSIQRLVDLIRRWRGGHAGREAAVDVLDLRQLAVEQARQYLQEKVRAATWLIKSIHQRQRTLYMVTSSIVKFQMEFLEREGVTFWIL